jgi:hypothetical protein
MASANWPISVGEFVEFQICNKDDNWSSSGGLYIFAAQNGSDWTALYVGQTNDFSSRIPNHERWSEASRLGATAVHARLEPLAAMRDILELKLIRFLQPQLNDQLR